MSLIIEIMTRNEFELQPPVLIDIGASGELNSGWKEIAKFSICIAFDADDREFSFVEKETDKFKKLIIFNSIVDDSTSADQKKFYLTSSPYCSSILDTDLNSLSNWIFKDLFLVEKIVPMKATNLKDVMNQLKISYIDWFKTDSQGIDLRLFKSLGNEISQKVLSIEFEPGIIDAYKTEDKFWHILQYMEGKPFWMDEMKVRGTQRISSELAKKEFPSINVHNSGEYIKQSPCWVEISYSNTFEYGDKFSKRDYLLGIAISISKEQWGFAFELATKAFTFFSDKFFEYLKDNIKEIILSRHG